VHRPHEFDLFDGHWPADGEYTPNGVGDTLLPEVQNLSEKERQGLGAVHMHTAGHMGYSNHAYMKFHGGGYMLPTDYRGVLAVSASATHTLPLHLWWLWHVWRSANSLLDSHLACLLARNMSRARVTLLPLLHPPFNIYMWSSQVCVTRLAW